MSELKVSLYNPKKHREEVLAIFKSRPDIFPDNEIKQIIEETKLPSEETHYKIVAECDEKVVGYGGAVFDSQSELGNLDWFAVGKQFQRQGVGSLLMSSIIEWLRSKKVNKLQVETCSCNSEVPARAFYASQGFVPIRTKKNGYAKGHSKITFLKRLQ